MICFMLGFLIVMAAVGGVEMAMDNTTVMLCIMIAAFGLGVMAIATDSIRGVR